MPKTGFTIRTLAAASALFLTAGPALAGDEERALAAIAQAQGKIDAAAKLKASEIDPAVLAKAQASLRLAQERLESGKEQDAIKAAIEAQQFADTAIGQSQARVETDAQVQASTAAAQQDAAAANARADAAERAAAAAAADARAARAAAVAPAEPAATTVTTETVKTAPATATRKTTSATRKAVRKTTSAPARATVVEKTTTTVTNR